MSSLACLLILGWALASCETENYETGDGKYSNMRADFADTHTSAPKTVVNMITDDGDSLVFKEKVAVSWAAKGDTTYRALVYYIPEESRSASVLSVQQVLVPNIRPHYQFKEIKTDPLSIESVWQSRNGRYMNFGLNLLSGSTSSDDSHHLLGMICDTLMQNADGKRHLHLRLFHDQGDVPQYYTTRAFLSIPLKKEPYRLQSGDTLSVVVNTYDGVVTKSFVY